MDDCITVENAKLKTASSSFLFNEDNTMFQLGGGNNGGKYKVYDDNHSLPNHTPPYITTISNPMLDQLKSFPGQGSQYLSENSDVTFCSNSVTKDQANCGNYLLPSGY